MDVDSRDCGLVGRVGIVVGGGDGAETSSCPVGLECEEDTGRIVVDEEGGGGEENGACHCEIVGRGIGRLHRGHIMCSCK